MKIAVLDIETTGFFDWDACIVEIGIVELDLKTGGIEVLYNEVIREEKFGAKHKGSWIFENSSLNFYEVMEAASLDFDTIQGILDRYHVTAYNKEFDFEFLKDRGFKFRELDCPMIVSTDICKLPSPNGYGYKWPKVEEAYEHFHGKTGYIEKHRGCDDAVHEAKIVYALHKRGHFKVPVNKTLFD